MFFSVGPNTYNENETIAKYEIMDGAPVRGKSAYFFFLIIQFHKEAGVNS